MKEIFLAELNTSLEFFNRSTDCLTEEHSGSMPHEGMMTAAQQVAHVAQTVTWFLDGAFGDGFDMDFESGLADVLKVKTMAEARDMLKENYALAVKMIEDMSMEDLAKTFPADSPIMGGVPRYAIFPSIVEHTAHHRGALTVYSRMLGITPAMPYM
ncbi:MAG: hypothetical protein COA73_17135 [Candidatus Hydrogenedentota bacterium]|nr:MAG: hypothetical protein COA73_17135 [Candidatus Hydrogenedentota bacterium]